MIFIFPMCTAWISRYFIVLEFCNFLMNFKEIYFIQSLFKIYFQGENKVGERILLLFSVTLDNNFSPVKQDISPSIHCNQKIVTLPPGVVWSFSATLCAWSISWCLQRTNPELRGPNTLLHAPYSWDSSSARSFARLTSSSVQAVLSGLISSCQSWKVPPSFSKSSTGSIRLIDFI